MPDPRPSRLGALFNTLARLVCIVALLVAVPVVLVKAVGWPLPTTAPSPGGVIDAISAGDYDPQLLVKVVAVVVWIAWAMTLLSFIVQTWAQFRQIDIACPRFVSRRLWSATGRWVSGVTVAASSIVVTPGAAFAAAPLTTITQAQPSQFNTTSTMVAVTNETGVTVQRYVATHDTTLFEVAQTLWGTKAATRYPELLAANPTVDPDEDIKAGTSLVVPTESSDEDWRTITASAGDTYLSVATELGHPELRASLFDANHDRIGRTLEAGEQVSVPVDPTTIPGTAEHDVVKGDTEWEIVDAAYGKVTWGMIRDLHETNRGIKDADDRHALYDEDLIHPGQSFELPAVLDGHPLLASAKATSESPSAREANADANDKTNKDSEATERTGDSTTDAETPANTVSTPTVPVVTTPPVTAPAEKVAATPGGNARETASRTDAVRPGGGTGTGVGATQRATNDVVAAADVLESDETSSIGPKIALATLGLGVLGAVWELRRRRRRRSKPTATTTPENEAIETMLGEGASLSKLRTARSVLPMLLNELTDDSALVVAMCVTDETVTVYLDEELAPTGEFNGEPGQWTIDIDNIDDVDAVHQMLPTLVSLGYSNNHGEVFIDIESLGCIEVDGPTAEDLIRSIATQLATRTDTVLELHTTMAVPDMVTGGAIVQLDTCDDDAAALILSGSAQVRTVLATNGLEASPQARHADIYGPLPAVVVALTGTQPEDTLAELTRSAGGGSGLGIIATQHLTPSASRITASDVITMTTSEGFELTIEHPSLLTAPTAATITELITHTYNDTNTPAPRHRIESLASIGLVDPDESLPPLTIDRESDVVLIAVEPYAEPDWMWKIAVLGRPTLFNEHGRPVSFTEGQPNRNGARGAELVAFLAHRPERKASIAEVTQSLWHNHPLPKGGTVDQLIVRTRLVTKGAVERNGDYVVLAANVVSDSELFTERYTHAAANPNREQARSTLREALATITGTPFAETRIYEWAIDHRIVDDIDSKIAHAVGAYVEWSIDAADYESAAWAVEQALLSNPVDEWVTRIGMRVDAASGNKNGLKRRYDAFIEALARQDLEPEEETVALYHQLTGRQQTAAV
jgi:LysM repeat protein